MQIFCISDFLSSNATFENIFDLRESEYENDGAGEFNFISTLNKMIEQRIKDLSD